MKNSYLDILNNLQEQPSRSKNDHVLVVDGMNTLIRAFVQIKMLNPQGSHTGGLVGFLRSLGYVTRSFAPTKVLVVWDGLGGSTNRKNINSDYKAQRTGRITNWEGFDNKQEESDSLSTQLVRLQQYLENLSIQQIEITKLEADDIIAYISKNTKKLDIKKLTIVSSDRDFLQLIDGVTEVWSPIKKVLYTIDNIQEDLLVIPENYHLVKSILGDNSDNLTGVKGVGVKSLVKLFPDLTQKPIDLDHIYNIAAENVTTKAVYAKIIHEWSKVETNYKLMSLHETMLSEKETQQVDTLLGTTSKIAHTGAIRMLLEQDLVESFAKNLDTYFNNFSSIITQ